MKAILLSLAICCTFSAFSQEGNSQELLDKGLKRYPVEKGKIEFVVSGDASGSVILQFDQYGWRSKGLYSLTLKQFGVTSLENYIEGTDGDFTYKVNLQTNKGSKKQDNRFSQLIRYKEPEEVVQALLASDGGVATGKETLVGKETTIWTFPKGIVQSTSEWNGLQLKIVKKLPGLTYEIKAVSFDEQVAIDPQFFNLPQEVDWE